MSISMTQSPKREGDQREALAKRSQQIFYILEKIQQNTMLANWIYRGQAQSVQGQV